MYVAARMQACMYACEYACASACRSIYALENIPRG